MNTIQLREGPVIWQQDANGITSNQLFPSSLTAGVAKPLGALAPKIHVAVVADATSGTSCTVHVLGLASAGNLLAASTWVWLGAVNGGSSITPNSSKWSASATRVAFEETITATPETYERFTTFVVLGGTGTAVSTWIGVSRP